MTLVEIMVALVLLGVIGGAIMRVIIRQQQFYNGATQIMTTRGQLRQAASVLPIDLRNLSSVGGDILEVTDSSIQFRVNVGTSVVCQIIDATHVALPPVELKSGVVLFGEPLPAAAIEAAFAHAERADLMLVIGSSLLVAPVSQLPRVVLDNGGTLAILTESETPYDDEAHVRLRGKAAAQMQEALAALDGS